MYFGEEYEENQGHTDGFEGRLSFEHNEQSAIEFHNIFDDEEFDRVDKKRIIDGILSHSISRVPEIPNDLVAQIIRQTDKIEYINSDLEEFRGFFEINPNDQEMVYFEQSNLSQRIENSIESMVKEAVEKGRIDDDNKTLKKIKGLRAKHKDMIYFLSEDGKRNLLKGDNKERQQAIYEKILNFYYQHPERIPTKSWALTNPINISKKKKGEGTVTFNKKEITDETLPEVVIKYVNTFTNKKCMDVYLRLVKERILNGSGYGIEPVTPEKIEKRKRVGINEQISQLRAKDIYKGKQVHTYNEYKNMLEIKYRKLLQELTPEAIENIRSNIQRREQENEEDQKLWGMVKEADTKRIENAMQMVSEDTINSLPKRIEMKTTPITPDEDGLEL